ncbi:MAG TPA: signal recognition particle-docking protein FtsY, partial [Burkholderiales bacterium]|nr:signal recognition particle-docking protein FtsY [Burkholderiales bacterium]
MIDTRDKAAAAPTGLFGRLRERLSKTTQSFGRNLTELFSGPRTLDAALLENLETVLLAADVGVETTQTLVGDLSARVARGELAESSSAYKLLRQDILDIVRPCARPIELARAKPFVIMAVGVNGVGKTTTVAKLARRLRAEGRSVLLAAADTFRAAAVEQLQTWGKRLDIPVIAQESGADAAAVAHDAMQAATARAVDVLIVDTAGRQHTHSGLMEELKKIHRVLGKQSAGAPHEVLLVLDATTGQNALSQLQHFGTAVNVTGLVLTKLDGTARGGIAI